MSWGSQLLLEQCLERLVRLTLEQYLAIKESHWAVPAGQSPSLQITSGSYLLTRSCSSPIVFFTKFRVVKLLAWSAKNNGFTHSNRLWYTPACSPAALVAAVISPVTSRRGPTSWEFQLKEVAEGHRVNPSWCFVRNTVYFAPDLTNSSAHCVALNRSYLREAAKSAYVNPGG